MSKIEWTGETWNPVVGCGVLSPGCTNCYAMTMASRLERIDEADYRRRVEDAVSGAEDRDHEERIRAALNNERVASRYAGLTQPSKAGAVWTGKVALAPDGILTKPLTWRKPRTIFVCSMADLFHESVPDDWIDRVFAVMALCPQHTFQVLTKRSARMRAYITEALDDRIAEIWWDWFENGTAKPTSTQYIAAGRDRTDRPWPYDNVWLGVSNEDQRRADERIPDLLATPAAVRFVSAEPLLGPVDFKDWLTWGEVSGFNPPRQRLDWIIVGGESGPNARPMHPDWARSIRDQCAAASVPFFFKQWGAWASAHHVAAPESVTTRFIAQDGRDVTGKWLDSDLAMIMWRAGKARAGRLLDGVLHDAMPAQRATAKTTETV